MDQPTPAVFSSRPRLAWREALSAVRFVKLGFLHEAQSAGRWPAFKGPVWRARFLDAMFRDLPHQAERFHGSPGGVAWALRPPTQSWEWVDAAVPMAWSVTLFNPTPSDIDACRVAARALSSLGSPQRGRELRFLGEWSPAGTGGVSLGDPGSLSEVIEAAAGEAPDDVEIRFLTPLVLRSDDGLLIDEAPSLRRLVRATVHAVREVCSARVVVQPHEWPVADAGGAVVGPTQDDVRLWPERCHMGGRDVDIRGLVGASYYGAAGPFWPWLKLAEVLHLGSGRHYGQGAIDAVSVGRVATGAA